MTKVLIAKNAGYCFGVKRAIETALNNADKNVCILGELIHNERTLLDLSNAGLKTISDVKEALGRTVLIRAHGEPSSTYEYMQANGISYIDCTCPFVEDIHKKVREYYNKGYQIIIIGKASHPEVVGINGWCDNTALVTDDFDEIYKITAQKLCVVAQTTYSSEKFDEIRKKIETLSDKKLEIFKTICYTTIQRQKETAFIARQTDAVIVIGGKNSSNTNKLFSIAKSIQSNTFLISEPDELDVDKIKKYRKVGIVLGASTPFEQAKEVIQRMEVTEVNTAEIKVDKVEKKVEKYTMEAEMKKLENKA